MIDRARGACFALALVLAFPVALRASTIVVPDDAATIQAALDLQPDTVLVRSGVYAERPVASYDVVVFGVGPSAPETDGLHIMIHVEQDTLVFENLHFRRQVLLQTSDETNELFAFRRCTFDSGFAQLQSDILDVIALEFSDCRISGPFHPRAEDGYVFERNVADTPILLNGGPLHHVTVRDNRIESPSPSPFFAGLGITDDSSNDSMNALVERNYVSGFAAGISIGRADKVRMLDNRVEDCTELGIRVYTNTATVTGNQVLRCGTGMILLGELEQIVERNVVGRSTHEGMAISFVNGTTWRIANNTLYENGGSGIWIEPLDNGTHVTVANNIGWGNGGYGIEGAVAGKVTLTCNDWFANDAGSASPVGPGATDLAVDPMFCGVANDDVGLNEDSPVAAAPGCGLIGAKPVGCSTVGVVSVNAQAFELAPITPNPTSGDARLTFRLPRAAAIELDILDLQGRTIARVASGEHAAGVHVVRWPVASAAPGVYFARYRHPDGVQSRRLIRVR